MAFGISVYPGLDNTTEENVALIRRAARLGVARLFTSLHIPEHDKNAFAEELRAILDAARAARLDLIADVTPESADILGIASCTPEAFHAFGIHTLRFDYGFGASEIAAFTRSETGARIQLNASTITEEFLTELSKNGADFSRLEALHNFYPRENTGLSVRAFAEKTALLHRFGVRVGAFAATRDGKKRGPLFGGLPTLELHRDFTVDLAVRHLIALGADDIFLSDSLPTDEELAALASAAPNLVTLRAVPTVKSAALRRFLSAPFTARPDEARDVVRAVESRTRAKETGLHLSPENTAGRPFGAVTLDNAGYPRYAGELQIIKRPQPADPRTNVIAHIRDEERFLIPCIRPGSRFQILLDEQKM
ncbi:MAG: DUF871 domain-containing protein [Schwartzia sp.]|nr:DUF871 domain-containing protein [Schwartzia sp. (in: firmicutes)]